MFRGFVICPEAELAEHLEHALAEVGGLEVVRRLDRYPDATELMQLVRAHAPHVLFLSVETLSKAAAELETISAQAPGLQVVAVGWECEAHLLLDVMRLGVREFLSNPFDRPTLRETLGRVQVSAMQSSAIVKSTEHLYSFLPSKPGVGASTVALNTAFALSRQPDSPTLLMDLDLSSGIIGFMLKLQNQHSVVDAAENSHLLDETIWPRLVSRVETLEVMDSGRLKPDFRIEQVQIQHILEFARRQYKAICVDLSGNMERYSIAIMHESRRIFMIVTPEIPSLHLARQKLSCLATVDLADRVGVVLNRSVKKCVISPQEVEDLVGAPVVAAFPNDYQGVHSALESGRSVDGRSELGKRFVEFANLMMERKSFEPETKKRFLDLFSILPGRTSRAPADG